LKIPGHCPAYKALDVTMSEPTSGAAAERRPPRADARRNRERILVVAREAFAVDGPSVSLDEIARRAGLDPGTVHRHFPTKEELLGAAFRAQRAGAVRTDIGVGELHAIIAGAVVIEQRLPTPAMRGRGIAVITDGLRR
jgi:AcrR family transcriptional regulator